MFRPVSIIDELRINLWVRQAQAGNKQAFGQLYDHLVGRIYRFVLLRVTHKETAEDLTHTTFMKVLDHLSTYTPRPNLPFSAWVFRIARNTVIDHFRQQRKTSPTPIEDLWWLGEEDSTLDDLTRQHQAHALRQALLSLPPSQREVITLRFLEDLPYSHIAQITGKSEVAIRVTITRTLPKLKTLLHAKI